MPTTAQRLRARRMELDLTREAVAYAAGLSIATVVRCETDDHYPSERTLRRLARALQLDADALALGRVKAVA